MHTNTPRNGDGTWQSFSDLIEEAEGDAMATGIIVGIGLGVAATVAACWIYDTCTKKEKAK